ncbi:MAG: RES family NAD+ phosphorylase [Candidatus Limnocylindrales bacterium]
MTSVPAGTVLFRVHAARRGSSEFNPGLGGQSRFAPLLAGAPPVVVPTLYASSSIAGAFSESIFHDVPYRGIAKRILISRLAEYVLSALVAQREIHVAQLAGAGLRRVGVRRRDLIDGGPLTYTSTVRWAAALHDCPAQPGGLLWTSRQDDTAQALVLFGDRVAETRLLAISGPIALGSPPGLDLVEQAANAAGISVVR